jgi:hypothetical protein
MTAPDKFTGNGSASLFARRVVLMTQLADVEHQIAKSHWDDGHISDAEYAKAIREYVARTRAIQEQWNSWQEVTS